MRRLSRKLRIPSISKPSTPRSVTPSTLHDAASSGDAAALEAGLAAGLDVDETVQEITPLMVAAMKGQTWACVLLLNAGANLHARKGPKGFSALVYATVCGFPDTAKVLIEAGADVSTLGPWLQRSALKGDARTVQRILVAGFPANNSEALHLAASRGYLVICKILLSHGVDPNKQRKAGMVPLHFAAQNGHLQVVQLLLAHGAFIDQANSAGTTPLILAVHGNRVEVVEVLLRLGANPLQTTRSGLTASRVAEQLRFFDILRLLPPPLPVSQQHTQEVDDAAGVFGASPSNKVLHPHWRQSLSHQSPTKHTLVELPSPQAFPGPEHLTLSCASDEDSTRSAPFLATDCTEDLMSDDEDGDLMFGHHGD